MGNDYKNIISEKKKAASKIMNSEQLKKCNVAIHTAAVASASAGFVPVPVADAVPITAAQIMMVIALGKIFNQNISEAVAKGVINAAAATFVGRNLVKLIPLFGWGFSAAVAAGVTEAIGWTAAVDFANNAKKEWERSIGKDEQPQDNPEEDKSTCETEHDELDEIVIGLANRSEPFLSGEKTVEANKVEYDALIKDFERAYEYDRIERTDPLSDIYDKLIRL